MIRYSYGDFQLTAKTDNGARRQAKQIDREEGREISREINFLRSEDGCNGWIVK